MLNNGKPKAAQTILVVDDEQGILDFTELGLKYEGFEVLTANNGTKGLELALQEKPDLVVLDVMLPGIDGMELCRRLRTFDDVPIIMLTAKDEVGDRIQGLNLGADDYLTKPFSFQELVARVRAVLRRKGKMGNDKASAADGKPMEARLEFNDVSLDPTSHEVRRNNQPVELTLREYELLLLFMRHPRQVLSREVIIEKVWGFDFVGDDNIIEVYVRYLRQKLGEPSPIQTVRGVGYILK
jgi:two-component system response regulator MprA